MPERPHLLVVSAPMRTYPRNTVLLRALSAECDLTERQFPEGVRGALLLLHSLFRGRTRYDAVLFLYPSTRFGVVALLSRLFLRIPILGDTFISLFDSYISDRALARPWSLKGAYYRILDTALCLASDMLFFDTEDHEKYFRRLSVVRKKTTAIIVPISIDTAYCDAITPVIPEEKERDATTRVVIFFGNYIPLQGAHIAIRAVRILEKERNIRFLFIGNGQTYSEVRSYAESEHLLNVRFVPRIPHKDLMAVAKGCDLALGIFGETDKAARVIPNKILEAMALGVPVVSGENGPMKSYFHEGTHIHYTKRGDAEGLAQAILESFTEETPEDRRRRAERARKVIDEHFSLDARIKTTAQTVSEYVLSWKARSKISSRNE